MSDAVTDSVTKRPAICLNMIVRNEAHIVGEALDLVAPYISPWVIVDTGSDDGTQDLIENHMARLGIPGELYERPWQNFGHNRTEALTLAIGAHGDGGQLGEVDRNLGAQPPKLQGLPGGGQQHGGVVFAPGAAGVANQEAVQSGMAETDEAVRVGVAGQ